MQHGLTLMCRVYGVTRAGYYAWRSRERSERERQNESLATEIREVHTESGGIYGSPRVHRALRHKGHRVGKHRVARLMQAHGIKARVVARVRAWCSIPIEASSTARVLSKSASLS
jgi:hypothetical protein